MSTRVQHTAPALRAPDFAPAPRGSRLDLALRAFCGVYLVVLLACVVLYKAAFLEMLTIDPYFAVYGIIVALYIVTRFALSVAYRPAPDAGLEPHVAIVMPAFNEEAAIRTSIRSLLALDYPEDKLEVVVINDGSTDGTLDQIRAVERESARVQVIDF